MAASEPEFRPEVVDPTHGGRTAIADFDGDGLNDIALHVWGSDRGKVADGKLLWYRYPDWTPTIVAQDRHFFGDMVQAADLDGDGDADLLAAVGNDKLADLWWYENADNGTRWIEHHFGVSGERSEVKDLEIEDMNGDDLPDVVIRLKNRVVLWYQEKEGGYTRYVQAVAPREGMGLGDLDEDGDTDIVLNGFWLENTGERLGEWPRHDIDPRFFDRELQPVDVHPWRHFAARIQFADINQDGHPNLIMSQAEHSGFAVSWYETSDPRGGPEAWVRHDIGVVDFAHTLQAVDFNHDRLVDVLVAGTRHNPASRVHVFYNQGGGRFEQNTWADSGPIYAASVGDIDNDGDIDLVSSYSWEDSPLRLWRNSLIDHRSVGSWQRRLVEGPLSHRILFVDAADFNNDGLIDLVGGDSWYEATAPYQYVRHRIGDDFNNFYWTSDFDDDGDLDLFGLNGKFDEDNQPLWAENDGTGQFVVHDNLEKPDGDFLQGIEELTDRTGRRLLALSWHKGNDRVEALVIPNHPATEPWKLTELASFSLNEELTAADMDQDGDTDLVLGNRWLEQKDGSWEAHPFGQAELTSFESHYMPDRNAVADYDGDGDLDVAVGLEKGIDIIVYDNPFPVMDAWRWPKRVIDHVLGQGFSLDAGDFDGDGKPDIVVGEHRSPTGINHVYLLRNQGEGQWQRYLVDRGIGEKIDHHDGTVARDLDGDGDLDIVSIGFNHPKIWTYENLGAADVSPTGPMTAVEICVEAYPPNKAPTVVTTVVENQWLADLAGGAGGGTDESGLVLDEVDASGKVIQSNLPFQFYGSTPAEPLASNLTGLAIQVSPAEETVDRIFRLRIGEDNAPESPITCSFPFVSNGVHTTRVTTANAQWLYDMEGAGFSRLLDADGGDWIGHSSNPGPWGKFRGMPNMGYPEGYMHPGSRESKTSVVLSGSLRVSLYSESHDGNWSGQWDIYPDRAELTVLRTSHPFWFLYEGVPGGTMEPDADYWIRSTGATGKLTESWTGSDNLRDMTWVTDRDRSSDRESWDGADPNHFENWIAFADAQADRALLLLNHRSTLHRDSYRLMDEAMTVFGFGRAGMEQTLEGLPAKFTVSLVESRDPERLQARARQQIVVPRVVVRPIRSAQ